MPMKTCVILAAAGTLCLSAGSTPAAPVANISTEEVNEISGEHDGGIEASNTDLLQTVGSITSSMGATFDGTISGQIVAGSLTTGTIAAGVAEEDTTNPNDANAIFAAGSGEWIEFALDTSSNSLGYDIASIATFSYWSQFDRTVQAYTVQVRSVGGSFLDLITIPLANARQDDVVQVEIIDGSSPVLASGIDAIRFNFANGESDWVAYREIDVEGTATVPEPGTLALFGLGALCIGYRRRR